MTAILTGAVQVTSFTDIFSDGLKFLFEDNFENRKKVFGLKGFLFLLLNLISSWQMNSIQFLRWTNWRWWWCASVVVTTCKPFNEPILTCNFIYQSCNSIKSYNLFWKYNKTGRPDNIWYFWSKCRCNFTSLVWFW